MKLVEHARRCRPLKSRIGPIRVWVTPLPPGTRQSRAHEDSGLKPPTQGLSSVWGLISGGNSGPLEDRPSPLYYETDLLGEVQGGGVKVNGVCRRSKGGSCPGRIRMIP